MSALPLAGRRVLFVGGKGGVGKSTTAAALAVGMAEAGKRMLLVSTDPAHSLGDLFGTDIGDREREILPGLHALEIDPEREVEGYIGRVKATMRHFVQPAMYSEIERQMELTRHSPGAEEAALMDRVAVLMDEGPQRHDRVIFDTAPTGHTLRLLALPEIMAAWTEGLLRSRDRSDAFGKAVARLRRRGEGSSREGSSGEGSSREGSSREGSRGEGSGGEGSGREGSGGEGPSREGSSGEGSSGDGSSGDGSSGDGSSGKGFRGKGSGEEGGGDELSWIDEAEETAGDERSRKIREVLLERRRRFSRARRLLLDPEVTAFVLVLVPEKLPILESAKTLEVLRRHKVPVAGIVVNRVLPEGPLGDFLESRRTQEAEYLRRVDAEFAGLPRVRVPLLPRDVEGLDSLREVGRHLVG